jgi:hypothetical protein
MSVFAIVVPTIPRHLKSPPVALHPTTSTLIPALYRHTDDGLFLGLRIHIIGTCSCQLHMSGTTTRGATIGSDISTYSLEQH